MKDNYKKILKATVKIEAGVSAGSGFHFMDNHTVISNAHVVESAITKNDKIYARIDNDRYELTPIAFCKDDINDFVILKSSSSFPSDRELLHVADDDNYDIGTELLFSGFPHGVDDLVVQKAIIAGNCNGNPNRFYLDGAVNKGNSGGPIIRLYDNSIIGIVTEKRFIKGKLENLVNNVNRFKDLATKQSKYVAMSLGGINYNVEMARCLADITNIFNEVVLRNANTGIGIGQKIMNAFNEYHKLAQH